MPAGDASDAVLNWDEFALLDFLPYSIGYRRAAETIREELGPRAKNGQFADFEFCAPIFLLRHAIELGLKFALLYARAVYRLNGGNPGFDDLLLRQHRLKPFWDELHRLLASGWVTQERTVAVLSRFTATIKMIDSVDPHSYTFRYPLDKQAGLSLPRHFRFSTVRTFTSLHELAEHLEYLGHEIDDWFDHVFHAYVDEHGYPDDPVLLRLRPPRDQPNVD